MTTTNISERQLLRRLRALMTRVQASDSTETHVLGIQINSRVLKLVISAQEPMKKAAHCYKEAERAMDELDNHLKQEVL